MNGRPQHSCSGTITAPDVDGGTMIEMAEVRAEPRSVVPLVCAVFGLAAFAAAQLNLVGQVFVVGVSSVPAWRRASLVGTSPAGL